CRPISWTRASCSPAAAPCCAISTSGCATRPVCRWCSPRTRWPRWCWAPAGCCRTSTCCARCRSASGYSYLLSGLSSVDERRTGYLLIALLAGQLVLVAIEGARSSRSHTTYAERLGMRIVGPVARLVHAASGAVAGVGRDLRTQGQLRD